MNEKYTLEELQKIIAVQYPDYIIVPSSDYENDSNESYKYLYENTYNELKKYQADLFTLDSDKKNLEKEYFEMKTKYLDIKNQLDNSLSSNIDVIKHCLKDNVSISDIKAKDPDGNTIITHPFHVSNIDELSNNPGVYEFKRPSWFTPLQEEMNKQKIVYKNIDNTKETLLSRLLFSKKMYVREISSEYDQYRKESISKILMNTKCSNEEKYLQYILITPGLSKDFQNILFSASDLGLDANIIIELLEQPKESFNKEVIEAFVSRVRKGTEYNLKQELAEDLVKGKWYISVNEDGVTKKLQLIPVDDLNDIQNKINKLNNTSTSIVDDNFEETNIEVNIPDSSEIYNNTESQTTDSSMLNFDDSMI